MSAQITQIRTRSAHLRRFVGALEAALWLLLLLERFGSVSIWRGARGADTAGLHAFGVQVVAAIPELLYLLALDAVRRALLEFERGQFYAPTITRMLDRVGVLLASGAFIAVFLAPALLRALGAAPGYWVAFDVSGLVLGALGLSLTVVARVIGHAAAIKAELDEIF